MLEALELSLDGMCPLLLVGAPSLPRGAFLKRYVWHALPYRQQSVLSVCMRCGAAVHGGVL